jgi:lipid-A-disaccharide synthase
MKYYIIAGEASGDLHASHLMRELQNADPQAEFRFFGGDMMQAVGGTRVRHYRELAYMGFVPVLLHLRTIMRNMAMCKADIKQWQPDAVILVDYPGFNLSIARFVKSHTDIPVFYYISPKIWAWKEWRIKSIKRDVDEMFSILPFEVPFFEQKHHYPIHYVGNPTADEVRLFKSSYSETFDEFTSRHNLSQKPIIALLAGSRRQEIVDNLPAMIQGASQFHDYQLVIAGAPSIDASLYSRLTQGTDVKLVNNDTYALLSHASLAAVTSGTATLETALFGVPQVVCYKTPLPRFIAFCRRHVLKVKYISLVNLIADEEVVTELVADTFSSENIRRCLSVLMPSETGRQCMLNGYKKVHTLLGENNAPENAARIMTTLLQHKQNS